MTSSTSDEPVDPAGDGGLVRLRLDLSYDGTAFSGWAAQPGRRSVQQEVEHALAVVLRLPEQPRLTVAGRTDAGVHASGQVAHVDVPAGRGLEGLARALNGLLAHDVRILGVTAAPDGFDARFSALRRRYTYRLCDGGYGAPPLRRTDTVGVPRRLDVEAMADAAARLVGLHDFAAFCRKREGGTTIRTLQRLECCRDGDIITVEVAADAFCHSMVRSLVGALIAVGEARKPVEWPAELLSSDRRVDAIGVAPPHGLTLVAVEYPPDDQVAARQAETRRIRASGV